MVRRWRGFWRASTKKGSTIDPSLRLRPSLEAEEDEDSMDRIRAGFSLPCLSRKEENRREKKVVMINWIPLASSLLPCVGRVKEEEEGLRVLLV